MGRAQRLVYTVASGLVGCAFVLASRQRFVATQIALVVFALVTFFVMFVRRRKLTVVRKGRELRIREGARDESVLVGEVVDVGVETRGHNEHAVLLVLRDGRRVAVGDARERIDQADEDRSTLRGFLLR